MKAWIVWVSAGLLSTSAAGQPASETAASVDLQPVRTTLADRDVVPVSVRLRGIDAPPVHAPTVSVSIGSISELESVGPFEYRCLFSPPPNRAPAVAVIAARLDTASGTIFGAATIELLGRARIRVETDEPNASVTVHVVGAQHGPFRTDSSGLLATSINVPPGVDTLEVASTDEAGNQSRRPATIAVEPFPTLVWHPAPRQVAADGTHPLVLGVTAIAPTGELVPFTGSCAASTGSLRALPPSGLVGRWAFEASRVGSGRAQIACRGETGDEIVLALELELVPGPTRTLSLEDVAPCVAGTTCELALTAMDAGGNRIAHAERLTFATQQGALGKPVPRGTDAFSVDFIAPTSVPADGVIEIAVADTTVPAVAALRLHVVGGPVSALILPHGESLDELAPHEQVLIDVRALDSFGNRLLITSRPIVSAKLGEARFRWGDERRDAQVLYRAPAAIGTEWDTLDLTWAGQRASLAVPLRRNFPPFRVGLDAGLVVQRDGRRGPVLTLHSAIALPVLEHRLAALLEIGGATLPHKTELQVGGNTIGRVQDRWWLAPVTAGMQFRAVSSRWWTLDVGATGGALFTAVVYDVRGDQESTPPDQRTQQWRGATTAHLRLGRKLGHGTLATSVETWWSPATIAGAIRGDVVVATLMLGWQQSAEKPW